MKAIPNLKRYILFAICLLPLTIEAQSQNDPTVRQPPTPVTLATVKDQELTGHQELRRTAIPFKPIRAIDKRTGQPLPNDKVITLPNGKKTTVGEYLTALNHIQKSLNERGLAIRSKEKGAEKIVRVQEPKQDPGLSGRIKMEYSRGVLKMLPENGAPVQLRSVAELKGRVSTQVAERLKASTTPQLQPPPPKPPPPNKKAQGLYKRYGGPKTYGDKSIAAVMIDGSALFGSIFVGQVSAHDYLDVDGYILGKKFAIASLSGFANSSFKGSKNPPFAQISVYLFGNKVYNKTSPNLQDSYNDSKSMTVIQGTHYILPLVYLHYRVRAGVELKASYNLSAAPGVAYGDVSFSTTAYVDGDASVGIGIPGVLAVRGGVAGRLNLAQDTLNIWGYVYVSEDTYYGAIDGTNKLSLLQGSLVGYVEIDYPAFNDDCSWYTLCLNVVFDGESPIVGETKRYEWVIGTLGGWEYKSALFNETFTKPLYE